MCISDVLFIWSVRQKDASRESVKSVPNRTICGDKIGKVLTLTGDLINVRQCQIVTKCECTVRLKVKIGQYSSVKLFYGTKIMMMDSLDSLAQLEGWINDNTVFVGGAEKGSHC